MRIPAAIKKWVLVAGFIAMFTTGYMATSVVTSCEAKAQCICGTCVYIYSGVSVALAAISPQVVAAIGVAGGYIIAEFVQKSEDFAAQVEKRFEDVISDIGDWFDTFWFYNLRPALQAMTEQLNTIDAEQTRQMAAMQDAAEMSRLRNLYNDMDVDSRREYTAGQNVCSAGTISGGMARANQIRKAYDAAGPLDHLPRGDNQVGTPAQFGTAPDMGARWQKYLDRYCRSAANGGKAGCVADAPFADRDLDVTGQIFQKDTIDLVNDAEAKQITDDIMANVGEPFAIMNISGDVIAGTNGLETLLEHNAYKARRQMVMTALNHAVARRFPGSGIGAFMQQMRGAAGVSAVDMSPNPSYNEVMEVMMNERFRTGDFGVQQVDEPENNGREMVIQQAFQVMQFSDYLDLLDRYGLVIAAQAGMEANETRPFGDRNDNKGLQ